MISKLQLIFTGLLIACALIATAQTADKLTSLGLSDNSKLGTSIATDGDLAALATPYGPSGNLGMLVIYEYNGLNWNEVFYAQGGFIANSIGMGSAVEIIGRDVFVSGPSAQVFRFSDTSGSWQYEQNLQPIVPYSWSSFGSAFSKYGNVLAIGDPTVTLSNPVTTGAVYLFESDGSNWTEVDLISNPISSAFEGVGFGKAIDLNGSRLLVGAPNFNSNFGAAYVFEKTNNQWTFSSELVAPTSGNGQFGYAVSLSGNAAAIGAPYSDSWLNGHAFVYRLDEGLWTMNQEIGTVATPFGQNLGHSLSLYGSSLLIGVPGGGTSGEVRVYQIGLSGEYELSSTLTDPSVSVEARFGETMAFNGFRTLIGAPEDNGPGANRGAALIYSCNDSDGDNVCDLFDQCAGDDLLDLDLDLLPDECEMCPDDAANDIDLDGVCFLQDQCHGYIDSIDTDADGIPNGCEGSDLAYCTPSFSNDCGDDVIDNWQHLKQISIFYPAGEVLSAGTFSTYLGHCPSIESCNTDNGNYNFHPVGDTKDKCPGYPGTEDNAYIDLVNFSAGQNFDLFVVGNSAIATQLGSYGSSISVFIDWNNDGDFSDSDENVLSTDIKTWSAFPSTNDNLFSIPIPINATNGTTRLRVIVSTGAFNTDPCLSSTDGSSRDYQLTITGGSNTCPADISSDGNVNVDDFLQLNSRFGDVCSNCPEDITSDGLVDVNDFLELNSYFGSPCD